MRARRARAEAPPPSLERVDVGAALGGFVRRALFLMVMLFVFFLMASFLVGGLFLQGFGGF